MSSRLRILARAWLWLSMVAVVVLGTHVLAYAVAPRPTLIGAHLEYEAGSPSYVPGVVALLVAVVFSGAVVHVASRAVAERARFELLAAAIPGLSTLRTATRAVGLGCAGSIAFALFESYLHWREGLGWHGLDCLVGPVHRDAVPIVAALSLLVTALAATLVHVYAWMRRLVATLRRPRTRLRPGISVGRKAAGVALVRSLLCAAGLGARAPPVPIWRPARRRPLPSRTSSREETANMRHTCKGMLVLGLTALAPLAFASGAWAHAEISPPVAKAKAGQLFTLAVPTEEEGATTTKIELTPPAGFAIDSFAPSPGWKRDVQQTGSGEDTVIQKVTWSGGAVPTEEDAVFQFLASPDSSKTYEFAVRQTYSSGKVVDWSGPESSDTPAPTIEAKGSLGGSGSSTLAIVALIVGAIGLLVGVLSLAAGKRQLA